MNPFLFITFCAFLLATTVLDAQSESGLIGNGSFEEESPTLLTSDMEGQTETLQTTYWRSLDAATRSDAKAHSGQWSAKLETTEEHNMGTEGFGQFFWTYIDHGKMIPGETLRVSAWVLNETFLSGNGIPTIWIEIIPFGVEGETIRESAPLPEDPTDGWVQVSVEVKVPEEFAGDWRVRVGASVMYKRRGNIEPGAIYFDDFHAEVFAE